MSKVAGFTIVQRVSAVRNLAQTAISFVLNTAFNHSSHGKHKNNVEEMKTAIAIDKIGFSYRTLKFL